MRMKLLVGLGNPGDKYKNTRHNLGFMALDEYTKKHLGPEIIWMIETKYPAEILKIDQNLWLVKPQVLMNNSGLAVKRLVDYYKVSVEDIIIIHDELDLPLGKIKIRVGGSAAGHHGVESIIHSLGSDKFVRVRLGIGPSAGSGRLVNIDGERFVLEPFTATERAKVKQLVKNAVHALGLILEKGVEKAQNQHN